MDFFSIGQFRWIRQASLVCLLAVLSGFLLPPALRAESGGGSSGRVSLDFNDVELSVFVRFISELTGKNFVLDDVVKKAGGKITVYSPTKVTHDQAYSMFVAALEVSRMAVVPKGNVNQIVAMGDLPPERAAFVYKLKHANATDLAAILTNLVSRSQTVAQTAPGARPLFRPLSEFEAPVQVFADKATNSIIISSTKSAYTKLQTVIRDLDTRPEAGLCRGSHPRSRSGPAQTDRGGSRTGYWRGKVRVCSGNRWRQYPAGESCHPCPNDCWCRGGGPQQAARCRF